jgi:hypothetical protein
MKRSLGILSVASILIKHALAQISSPISISQAPSVSIESQPTWTLQNLTLALPSDQHPSASPKASIEFTISGSNNRASVVRCNAFWDPNKPPKDLQKCMDNATYWRFGRDLEWQRKDFWLDIVRPSFTPYVVSSPIQIELERDIC